MNHRPYTNDEDAMIVSMRQDGATYQQIGQAVGRRCANVYQRAIKLGVSRGEYHREARLDPDRCSRCGIILAVTPAPAAPNGYCAWCVKETATP